MYPKRCSSRGTELAVIVNLGPTMEQMKHLSAVHTGCNLLRLQLCSVAASLFMYTACRGKPFTHVHTRQTSLEAIDHGYMHLMRIPSRNCCYPTGMFTIVTILRICCRAILGHCPSTQRNGWRSCCPESSAFSVT